MEKFLDKINAGQFPPEMVNYKEMFLSSRKAIVYELVLHQVGYHSMTGLVFLAYTYFAKQLYDKQTER